MLCRQYLVEFVLRHKTGDVLGGKLSGCNRYSNVRTVAAKHTGITTTFRPGDGGWAAPYELDIDGRPVDEVIDWTALEYEALRHDKFVATLMVLAAEAVKVEKRSPDYWQAEHRGFLRD